ncbi:Acetyltransferase (GNAT) domain-containing protein [Pseudomonas reinekei]|uniref:Acetyltransferase (GNAT) domain-containing protein n=1 Tax=Pseudomonas reinekei TaxID=395598 RepID=A0A1H0HUW0_PSERE|nr:GNAT family N-acetyltransferase [Pseudomonas reinekei]KAB0486999.1 GNAT family N-acetyltransferase [Pseudomonas reinekei]OLU04011.1 cellulose biosynthesis protein [Pseudomonas reinekei]SDO22923.1 Acetyltransferase (GNAT) domain-containing protein [Pseudomonas reinekei]
MTVRFEWRTSLCATDFPAAAYEALRLRVMDHTPFNALAWMVASQQALTAGERLHVLLGWQADELVLCLPLVASVERFGGLPFRVLHHLGYPLADRLALLACVEAEDLRKALTEVRRRLPHALLQLNELAGEDSVLTAWLARSSTAERRLSCRAPVHLMTDADRQEVSGDPRYKLRRARKRIAACGAQVRRITPDATTMGPLLKAIAEVEAVSWKGDEGVGIFADERHRQWMDTAFTALAAQGLVRVVTLELDGRCISYRLGLLEQGRLYDYNLAFLPQYANLGSGRVLLDEWIRWGLDDNWFWIDASRVSLENSSHQLHERMTGHMEHWRWSFYSWRPSGLALGLALRLWQHVKPRLQQWRAKRAAAASSPAPVAAPTVKPPASTDTLMEGEHATPSHSQR